MTLKTYLKKLEKNRTITRKPHPIIPFLLTIIYALLASYSSSINHPLTTLIVFLAIFTFIFAILHLIVYKLLTS